MAAASGGCVRPAGAGTPHLAPHELTFEGKAAPGSVAASVQLGMQTLNAALLGTHNVTLALEAWCGAPITVQALPPPNPAPEPSAGLQARLAANADEPMVYRLVELVCEGAVVARADNWYLPGRLPAKVQARLASGGLGFGRAVLPMDPSRRTLSVTQLWSPPLALQRLEPGVALFRHQAQVLDGTGLALAEVNETVFSDALARRIGSF
jgi:hypothetical protein